MTLRTSLVLLSLAFSLLVAIVALSVFGTSPRGILQSDLEQLRTVPIRTEPPLPSMVQVPLPELRDAQRAPSCRDPFQRGCELPSMRPVTITR